MIRTGEGRAPFAAVRAAVLAAVLVLVGCDLPAPTPVRAPAPPVASAESERLRAYYASVQARLLSQGLLRTDGGGPDTPFTQRDLVENFDRIALHDEYVVAGGRFVARKTPSHLRRWERPVRIRIIFGDSVATAQRQADTRTIADFARRLSGLTGLDIALAGGEANFFVLVASLDEQAGAAADLRAMLPRTPAIVINEIANSPRSTFCAAYAMSDPARGRGYVNAVVHIKAEHEGLMRLACIHEELAQAMGLANDSPRARPSIFNDDEEFALLTRHDELLLRILYDRRLRVGMNSAEALPIVRRIVAELMGGES